MKKILVALALALFAGQASAIIVHARIDRAVDVYALHVGSDRFDLLTRSHPLTGFIRAGHVGIAEPAEEFDFEAFQGQVIRFDVAADNSVIPLALPVLIAQLTLPDNPKLRWDTNAGLIWGPAATREFRGESPRRFSYTASIYAIPEPQTWAMLALGLVLTGVVVRRVRSPK